MPVINPAQNWIVFLFLLFRQLTPALQFGQLLSHFWGVASLQHLDNISFVLFQNFFSPEMFILETQLISNSSTAKRLRAKFKLD